MSTHKLLIAITVTVMFAGCVHYSKGDHNLAPDATQVNIERVIGNKVSNTHAIETIDEIFSAEPREVEFCCGTASCECTDLGDCINLWFANTCADIPGPDIVGGQCENAGGCTNDDCNCPG